MATHIALQTLGVYLSLFAEVKGKGQNCPFPGSWQGLAHSIQRQLPRYRSKIQYLAIVESRKDGKRVLQCCRQRHIKIMV